ncbi:hypothetical protein HNY73_019987 [Argiope bruennichi]|uniref:Uncharacterized protein n=1 Tax=Argiope bruennichi TaxID=94029 RepID=A0A8T0E5D5_ARGBR|nr:hypothetical protein HNY73_019987 [Argiope bruennichi]
MKVRESVKTASATDEIYKPELFAYQKMQSFLLSVYTPRSTKTSEKDIDEETPSSHTHQFLAHLSTSQDEEFSSGNGAVQGGPPKREKQRKQLTSKNGWTRLFTF